MRQFVGSLPEPQSIVTIGAGDRTAAPSSAHCIWVETRSSLRAIRRRETPVLRTGYGEAIQGTAGAYVPLDCFVAALLTMTIPSERSAFLLSECSRLGVPQPLEAGELVCEQFALFVAPDKDLEHRPALAIDELQRAGPAAEEGPVDKIDWRDSRNA